MNNFELQPQLKNHLVRLEPLVAEDFEKLYAVAADPLIWEQHPNHDRYQREVFRRFFDEALSSGSAFIIYDQPSGEIVGSSRYYDIDPETETVAIGYTFIGRRFWGGGHNVSIKQLMLDHAFKYVEKVILHIGASNYRSQKAAEKIGFSRINEIQQNPDSIAAPEKVNYEMSKDNWIKRTGNLLYV